MFFTILVLATALALESLGSYISVIGLSSKASPIIVFLAIVLDVAKVMIATVLYKRWKDIHFLTKSFLVPALLFLMIVTSSGTYAFLLKEFSKTTAGQEQVAAKIELLNTEKNKLELRKKEIDGQISQLPASSFVQRKRMTDLFSKELNYINERVIALDKEIPQATLQAMEGSLESGTLGSIAKAYGTSAENISKIIAFLIVLVIDPLAIVLLTVANFLMEQRKKERRELLLKKLNGEEPLDDESLLQEIKNKINFMRSKFSKENLSISNFLRDSKDDVVKKPLMSKDKERLYSIEFVLSTKLVDNPKIFIPIKYSSNFEKLNLFSFLKESRSVIFKTPPEKIMTDISLFSFITNQETIHPEKVIDSLDLQSQWTLVPSQTIISDIDPLPLIVEAEKRTYELLPINFCLNVEAIEPIVNTLNKENNAEILPKTNIIDFDIVKFTQPVQKQQEFIPVSNFVIETKEISIPLLFSKQDNSPISSEPIVQNFDMNKFIQPVQREVSNLGVTGFIKGSEVIGIPLSFYREAPHALVNNQIVQDFEVNKFLRPMQKDTAALSVATAITQMEAINEVSLEGSSIKLPLLNFIENQEVAIEKTLATNLPVEDIFNSVQLVEENEQKLLTGTGTEYVVATEFIFKANEAKPAFFAKPTTRLKKVEKPVPKTIHTVEGNNGGFFENVEPRRFIPSYYEEPMIYEEEVTWDEDDFQKDITIQPVDNHEADWDNHPTGFKTTDILNERITF